MGASSVRGGPTEEGISNEKVKMSDRLEALLGLEGPGIWQECERRVALDHRL